jgi:hypothetical protein
MIKFIIISLLSFFSLFSLIRSEQKIEKIGMSNFVELVRNDKVIWVIGVINSNDAAVANEYMSIYEGVLPKIDFVKFGIINLGEEEGKQLLEGIELKLPATLMFNDLNLTWIIMNQVKLISSSEIATLIEHYTKDSPKNEEGMVLKTDIPPEPEKNNTKSEKAELNHEAEVENPNTEL